MKLPLVSVIIPVFNTGKKAKKLVNNLLGDSYKNIEIIVVDDGSSDNSIQELKTFKSKNVHVYGKQNGGPSSARNFGIKEAKGDYLIFIDSDDSIKDGFISKLVDGIQKEGVALVSTGVKYKKNGIINDVYLQPFVRRKGEGLEKFVLRSLLADGRMYPAFNKIFDAGVVRKYKMKFDERMNFGEDTKFVLDYLKRKDGSIKFILEPLYIYNAGTDTSTAARSVGVWANWQKCYKNLKKWTGKTDIKGRLLLRLIYLKWRVSWLKTKLF